MSARGFCEGSTHGPVGYLTNAPSAGELEKGVGAVGDGGCGAGDAVHVRLFMFLPAESDTGAPGAGQEAEGYGERDADCKEEADNDDQDEADAAPIRAPAPTDAVRDAARRRLAPAVFECAFNTHAVVHAPAEVLIEGPGVVEHKVDIRDLCGNQNFTARSC